VFLCALYFNHSVRLIFAGLLWDGAVAASSSPAAAPLPGSSRQLQCFVAPKVEGTVLVGQPNGWWRAAERLGLLSPAGINPAARLMVLAPRMFGTTC